MVHDIWTSTHAEGSPMERWQTKIRKLRQYLRGWAKHTSRVYKKEKKKILNKIDALDKKAESTILEDHEINLKHVLSERLADLLREEELIWYQRAKLKNLLEGDANTKFYHLVANGKHRKTRIFQLHDGEVIISGDEALKKHISSYYKGLFGPPESNEVTLDESITNDIPQVSQLENEFLVDQFSETEVRTTVFQMNHNKAPGPDGFPPEFYQVFWETIMDDLMALFREFHNGSLPLHCLNFGTIILLPKQTDAMRIQQYRPICLLNVSFKMFTKVATNIISSVAQKIIRPTQTAFLPGRNIMEGAVILHETTVSI